MDINWQLNSTCDWCDSIAVTVDHGQMNYQLPVMPGLKILKIPEQPVKPVIDWVLDLLYVGGLFWSVLRFFELLELSIWGKYVSCGFDTCTHREDLWSLSAMPSGHYTAHCTLWVKSHYTSHHTLLSLTICTSHCTLSESSLTMPPTWTVHSQTSPYIYPTV